MNFTKIFGLKVLKPKNKGHTNFYECCDLTKKVYLLMVLMYVLTAISYVGKPCLLSCSTWPETVSNVLKSVA